MKAWGVFIGELITRQPISKAVAKELYPPLPSWVVGLVTSDRRGPSNII